MNNWQTNSGYNIIVLNSVDSTNNYAANLLRTSKVADRTVILSQIQTDGRGQSGKSWVSSPGLNLTMTLIRTEIDIPLDRQCLISQSTALSIMDVLHTSGIEDVSLKWPNDVLVGGKKIAGILIENTLREQRITSSCIGVGLNVNQRDFEGLHATSILNLTEEHSWIEDRLHQLLETLNSRWEQARANPQSVIRDYTNFLFRREIEAEFLLNGSRLLATIKGVDNYGRLLLESAAGLESVYQAGEIEFIL